MFVHNKLLQLEQACLDEHSKGKPLLEDLIREEILKSKATMRKHKEKDQMADLSFTIECRQVLCCLAIVLNHMSKFQNR